MVTNGRIRTLVVDDHDRVRDSLILALESQSDFQVVAHAKDGIEAIKAVETYKPDVVVMDMMMDNMNGIEATKQILACESSTCIVMLSGFWDLSSVLSALDAGITSFLIKDISLQQLRSDIRASVQGRSILAEPIQELLMQRRQQASWFLASKFFNA